MAKSRARYLAELLNSDGLVQTSLSALAGADGIIDLEVLPTIPNSQLEHSSVSIAGHSLSLGGSLSLDTEDIGEHTSYLYFTNARARAAISVSGSLSYDSGTGVISYTTPTTISSLSNHTTDGLTEGSTNLYFTNARARGAISVSGAGSYDSGTGVITITGGVTSVNTQTGAVTLTTDNIAEGSTNLYYTDARVGSYLTANTYATQSYVTTAISNLVDSAPATLDTLNELAAALGDDPNFATTVTNSIATKWTQDNTKISNWDTAYGWGNHASAGYQPISTALTTSTTFGGDVSGTYNAIVVANDSHSHTKLSGFANQTEYDLIRAGNTNGLYFKARWDSATANRYWDMGYVDGFGTFYTGLKVYNNGALVYKDNTVWHAGNDGSGSGLDADLLDGQHGSYYYSSANPPPYPSDADTVDGLHAASFLRSDANDTHTHTLTFSRSSSTEFMVFPSGATLSSVNASGGDLVLRNLGQLRLTDGNAWDWNAWAGIKYDTGGSTLYIGGPAGAAFNANASPSNIDVNFVGLNSSGLKKDGNVVWHAGNDGSGSGLDADTLDSYDYTQFNGVVARYRTTSSATGRIRITLPLATNSARMLKFTISQLSSYQQSTYEISGYLYPTNNNWYLPKCVYTGTTNPDIIVGRDANGYAYVSIANGNYTGIIVHSVTGGYQGADSDGYGSWTIAEDNGTENSVSVEVYKTWNSRNDGSGSGLDADLLDGLNSASFLRSDVSDTASGQITFTSTAQYPVIIDGSNNGKLVLRGSSSPYIRFQNGTTDQAFIQSTSSSLELKNQADGSSIRIKDAVDFSQDGTTYYSMWHAGNDGSGSGLDADTVDGYHAAQTYYSTGNAAGSFLGGHYSSGGTEKPNSNTFGAGKFKIAMLSSSNLGFGGSWNDVLWTSSYTGSDVKKSFAFVSSKYDDTSVWLVKQNYDATAWGTGYLFWNAGNDGSGSGLDADLLDGQHGSYYAPASSLSNYVLKTGDTITGIINTQRDIRSAGQIRATGWWNDAASTDYSGLAFEIGVSSGAAHALSYNRDTSSYGVMRFRATDFDFNNPIYSTGGSTTKGVIETDDTDQWWIKLTNYDVGMYWNTTNNHINIRNTYGDLQYNGNKVWHAGNDGAGSGLDADFLDGLTWGDYKVTGHSYLNVQASNGYGLRFWNGNDSYKISMAASNTTGYGRQGFEPNSDYNMYFRMDGGTNRGFVFQDGTSNKVGIDSLGNIRADGVISSNNKQAMNCAHWSAAGTSTGAIKIALPGTTSNFSMPVIEVTTYDYSSKAHVIYNISGHNWSTTNFWYNTRVTSEGGPPLTVRLGHDGTTHCIFIGETNTSWSYGSVTVALKAHPAHYASNQNFTTGWGISQVTSLPSTVSAVTVGQLWHSVNDGSGSGLDADTLDGQQGSYYQPASTAITTSSTQGNHLYIRNANPTIYLRDTDNLPSMIHQNSNLFYILRGATNDATGWNTHASGAANNAAGRWPMEMNITDAGNYVRFASSALQAGGYTVWHAGNDGSGSGLDADLLDGLNSTSFVRSDASDEMVGHLIVKYNGVTTTPGYTQGQVELYTDSNYVPAIGFHRAGYSATTLYENDGQLYVNPWVTRAQAGLLLSTGNIGSYAWTSINDGSGSGLDADTVDGLHASQFLRSDTADIMSGAINFDNEVGRAEDKAYIEFYVHGSSESTYYPVVIGGANEGYAYKDYSISRRYNWTAPSSWNTASHMGGLTLTWQHSSDTAWGGNDKEWRVIQFDETYTQVCQGLDLATTGGMVVWLRGGGSGGARYRLHSPLGRQASVTIYDGTTSGYSGAGTHASSTTFTSGSGVNYNAESANTTTRNNRINPRWPVRDRGYLYHNGNGVWHTGNDGAGSGLDADTLDGNQSSFFADKTNNQSFAGSLALGTSASDTTNLKLDVQGNMAIRGSNGIYFGVSTNNYNSWTTRIMASGSTQYINAQTLIINNDGYGNTFGHTFNSSGLFINGNTAWHSGNDGSGSGLDADTLDGIQGSSYAYGIRGSYGSLSGSSGNWFPIAYISDGSALIAIRTYAHSSVLISASKGYSASGQSNVQVLSSCRNENGGYANISGVRIRESGWVEIQLTWSSGPAVAVNVQVLPSPNASYQVASSLAATTASDGIYDQVTLVTGRSEFRRIRVSNDLATGGSIAVGSSLNSWNSSSTVAQVGAGTVIEDRVFNASIVGSFIGSNYYRDTSGNYKTLIYGATPIFSMSNSGNFIWYTSSSVSAGATATLTEVMQLTQAGNLTVSGNITAYSDRRIKNNILPITDALNKLQKLNGTTYNRTDTTDKESRFAGLIAQDVETVLPEAVTDLAEKDIKSLDYSGVVALLVEAVKELKAEVDDLKSQLKEK